MDIVINKSTLAWVAGVIISITVIVTGVASAVDNFIEWHDDRWITIAGLEKIFNERDLRALKDKIAEYEWIKNEGGGLTQKQKWELGRMYDELENATP